MRSSTSSSDAGRLAALLRHPWLVLLVLLAVLLSAGELLCRFALPRFIGSEMRRQQEWSEAVVVSRGHSGQRTVLLLGNSLLAEGVNLGQLRQRVSSEIVVSRLQVEGTTYFDWYYGLQRLLHAGARPDLIVLMMSPDQLASAGHRGDYSAFLLMRTADAWSAGHEMGLTNTQSADLVISSASALFGMRTSIRKRVVQYVVPGLDRLMPVLTYRPEPMLKPLVLESLASERLRALRTLVEKAGSRFVLVVPPTNDGNIAELTAAVVRGARSAGLEVVLPVAPGTLSKDKFQDGFHLSRSGSEIFTPKLADEINRLARRG